MNPFINISMIENKMEHLKFVVVILLLQMQVLVLYIVLQDLVQTILKFA